MKVLRGRPGWVLLGVAAFIVSTGLLLGVTTRCIAGAGPTQHEMGANMIQLISLFDIPMPVAVAQANSLFAKHGVMVHAEKVQDADQLRAALLDGNASIAEAPVEYPISMLDSAQADVVIIMGGESLTGELIVQPNIKSVSDLRGKTIILEKMDSMYTFGIKKILSLKKLKPGTDCDLKVIGPAPERLQAMIFNKEYAATIQEPPVAILAKRAGMVSLGPVAKLMKMGQSQGVVAFAQRQWARQHADLVRGYIAAYVEAQRWLTTPKNKDRAIEFMAKESKLPLDVSRETYEMDAKSSNGWTKDARFDVKGFKNDLKLWREFKNTSGGKLQPAEKYYDLSFYREALLMVKHPH